MRIWLSITHSDPQAIRNDNLWGFGDIVSWFPLDHVEKGMKAMVRLYRGRIWRHPKQPSGALIVLHLQQYGLARA